MDENSKLVWEKRVARTLENLEKNRMKGYYAETKEQVPALVRELLHDGDTVAFGGSMSLSESGVMDLLRSGKYRLLDREAAKRPEEREQILRQAFSADAYLASSNALTENGELYNVDGNGNRVAALTFGPASVILVVGRNKLVRDLGQAVDRVKTQAAPANSARLHCDTYCAKEGRCLSCAQGREEDWTAGCSSDGRICCTYVVMGRQRVPDRIKVILVGEELGY